MRRLSCLSAAILLLGQGAYAESEILQEIEVKARKETRVESIEVREVRESHAHDTGEALEAVGNVCKVRKGGIANDIVIRGFQRDNISVTIDGARVHGACPNRMDPPAFHIDYAEVERVDVKKGPFDVSSPGSLGGLVDIRTKSAGPGAHGELLLGYGSFGSFEGSAVLSYGSKNADVLLGGAYKSSDPYESGDGRKITEIYPAGSQNRYRDPDASAYDMRTGWVKAGVSPAEGHRLEASYARQEADDVLYPYLFMDAAYDDTDRANVAYRVETPGGPVRQAKIQVYWDRVRHDMDDGKRCSSADNTATCAGTLPRSYSMRSMASTDVVGGKLEGRLGNDGRTVVGVDFFRRNWDVATTRLDRTAPTPFPDNAYATVAAIPDVDAENAGFFASYRQPLGKNAALTAGVRFDIAKSTAGIDRTAVYRKYFTDVATSRTDRFVTGNLQADFEISPTLSVFAGIGRGARAPDPQERFFALPSKNKPNAVGNPGLKPVKNTEADLGARYAVPRLLLKAQIFYSDLDDFIVVRDVDPVNPALDCAAKSWANVDAAIYGGEMSARVSLPANFYVSALVAFTRGRNESERTDLPEIPPLKGRAALRYDVETWFAEGEGVFAARQAKVDAVVQERETAGWAIANVKAGFQHRGFRLLAGVRNIFDKFYYEHLAYIRDPFATGQKVPEPGRTFEANVQYAF